MLRVLEDSTSCVVPHTVAAYHLNQVFFCCVLEYYYCIHVETESASNLFSIFNKKPRFKVRLSLLV